MSQTVQVGGTDYTIPDQGDPPNWGTNLTPFFVALAAETATAPAFYQGVAVNSTPVTVATEQTYLVASNSITATLNLPTPVQNLWFAVKDSGKNAGVNNITIHRHGSESINGVASDFVITTSGGFYMFGCDGTNWFLLSNPVSLKPLNATNQLVISPSNGAISTTLSFPVPVASRVITIGDPGADANVIVSAGAQSVGGVKTFSSAPIFSAGFTSNGGSSITGGLTITDTTNQLILGTTRTITITAPTPASSSRTYTIPDAGTNTTFVTTDDTSTIGAKTFAGTVTITPTTNQLVLGTTRTVTISATQPASTSRTWTIPDITGNGTFAALEGTQIFTGSKTLSASTVFSFAGANAIDVNSSLDGLVSSRIFNSSNTSSAQAALRIVVAGSTASDPYIEYNVSGATSFTTGADNSDGDSYAISRSATLGTNNSLRADGTTGAVTIRGTTTNDSAAAGFVGEYLETLQSTPTNVPAATTVVGDLTSVTLTAGDWDISATVLLNDNGGSISTFIDAGIGTASGTSTTGMLPGINNLRCKGTDASGLSVSIPPFRVSLSGSTTYYFKGAVTYTVATPQYRCRLSARRVR